MRARFGLLCAIPFALFATTLGCSKPPVPSGPAKPAEQSQPDFVPSKDEPNADVGVRLYKPADAPKFAAAAMPGTDPIAIPSVVNYEERQIVSAEVDGKIELVATPMTLRPDGIYEFRLPDGTVVATHDPAKFNPKNPHPRIDFSPRERILYKANPEKWVPYYKLREGDVVASDQTICVLDDSLVKTKRDSADKIKKASIEGKTQAEKGVKYSEDKIALYKDKLKTGVVSQTDYLNDLITLSRFEENVTQALQTIAKAEADYDEAQVMLTRHHVKTRVNGILRNVAKRDGEYAHAGEKIFEIQSTEKVRLEGMLDVQYYDRVMKVKRENLSVTVEPAVPSAPVRSHASHQLEVAGIAVTGHPDRPLVVSAALDGKVLVWDPNLREAKDAPIFPHNLPHPVAVRCVATTPLDVRPVLAITGADDGKVRIWNLANPDKLPTTPASEPADFHTSAVTAVAVSPDGKFAATAAGREVFIWNLADGKRLYSLPPEHRDTVTALSFTPQAQLMTASRDRTLKVWKLGSEKAAVTRTIDHRAGLVDLIGVSPDGGRVLFDQEKGRIDLVDMSDAQTVGQLTNVGPNLTFATLALFGPDHAAPGTSPDQLPPYTIVTAGGEGDLKGSLQVWQAARAGGRGTEIGRLITPGRVAVTCAAFSPHKDTPFLVVGTAAGTVHVWTPPSGPAKKLEGMITNVDATDPRYVTVRVEMSNKDLGLLDRSAATVIIKPRQ